MAMINCRDCGESVSTLAKSCPKCGRPVSRSGPTPAAAGCLGVIGLIVVIAVGSSISKSCEESRYHEQQAKADAERQQQQDAAKKAVLARITSAKLASLDLAADCVAFADSVPAVAFPVCRDSELLLANDSLTKRDAAHARTALTAAVKHGLDSPQSGRLNEQIDKLERRAAAKRELDQAQTAAKARKAYGAALRERFLDKGMDVKVHVSGRNNDRIALEWSLFNDVWTHKMEKPDGIVREMKQLGFRRVDVTDGYRYSVYWDFKEDE